MTADKLVSILSLEPKEIISKLSESSFDLPLWSELKKQYYPNEHAIRTNLQRYPIITNPETGADDMKRITRSLQMLACDRMAQTMFSSPSRRIYSYDEDSEQEKLAVEVIEELYKTQNNINGENIERAKKVHASCQAATIWYTQPKEQKVKGLETKFKLKHTTYSEIDGYVLYPIIDQYRDLLVLSISYTDSEDVEHFDIYANLESPLVIRYVKSGEWQLEKGTPQNPNPKTLSFFPVVYKKIDAPVWGGDSGTSKVETIEETLSYRAMYIKANSVPLAYMDFGEVPPGSKGSTNTESNNDKKRLVRVGKGGKIEYVVWDVNNGTVDSQIKDLEAAFFSDNQIPDTSFANMIKSNTSADNKEIVLTDCKGKAIDMAGEWVEVFNTELKDIVFEYAKVMFPSLSAALDNISVRTVVTPYNVRTKKENAEIVATAGNAMSTETKVRLIGEVDDIEAEVNKILEDDARDSNNL